jgi:hypothetical protein
VLTSEHPQIGGKSYSSSFAPARLEVAAHLGPDCPLTLVGRRDRLVNLPLESRHAYRTRCRSELRQGLRLEELTLTPHLHPTYIRFRGAYAHILLGMPLHHAERALTQQACAYKC